MAPDAIRNLMQLIKWYNDQIVEIDELIMKIDVYLQTRFIKVRAEFVKKIEEAQISLHALQKA